MIKNLLNRYDQRSTKKEMKEEKLKKKEKNGKTQENC